MRIITAEVNNTISFFEDASFYVTSKENDSPFKVQYMTPYLGGRDAGFIAVPEIGTRVLICQPDGDEFWYYMGSTPNFGLGGAYATPETTVKDKHILPDHEELYKARKMPQRYSFTSPKGNSLILSDSYNPDYFNAKAQLKSGTGKKLSLIDSPKEDCVILENEHGDKITISSTAQGSNAPRSITIECQGAINVISRESTMNLLVTDGKELNIINSSTGSKRSGSNDPTCGNVNITSNSGDINITTKSDTGSVFIDSEGSNAHISLNTPGGIDINADKGININSSGKVIIQGQEIHLN